MRAQMLAAAVPADLAAAVAVALPRDLGLAVRMSLRSASVRSLLIGFALLATLAVTAARAPRTVAADSSGNGRDGTLGAAILLGQSPAFAGGGTSVTFPGGETIDIPAPNGARGGPQPLWP